MNKTIDIRLVNLQVNIFLLIKLACEYIMKPKIKHHYETNIHKS